jgi:hypothetical protein
MVYKFSHCVRADLPLLPMASFITVDRKILKWEWYQDVKVFHLFLYFLLRANWQDGRWKGIEVKRGQLITGRLQLSKDTGLSEREIRTCLEKLKTTGEVTIKATSKYSVVTVCKYDVYQNKYDQTDHQSDQHLDQRATSHRPTSDQPPTTNNTLNNNKEEEQEEFLTPKFSLQKIYDKSWEEYRDGLNGQAKELSEIIFITWKEFVDFLWDNNYVDMFKAKFVSPIDFGKLVIEKKFTSEKWKDVVERLLSSGIEPKHNLFYRIPQYMGYGKQSNSTGDKSAGSASRKKIEALRNY